MAYLQNKIIGDNHTQMDPTYKYRAWYKAFTRIEIGNLVTPKTDPGDYIIESTGDITVYAGESIVLKPGFHAQNGCNFHAFIKQECVKPPENVPVYTTFHKPEKLQFNETFLAERSGSLIENQIVDENMMECEENNLVFAQSDARLINENIPDKPNRTALFQWFAVRNDEEP